VTASGPTSTSRTDAKAGKSGYVASYCWRQYFQHFMAMTWRHKCAGPWLFARVFGLAMVWKVSRFLAGPPQAIQRALNTSPYGEGPAKSLDRLRGLRDQVLGGRHSATSSQTYTE